MSVSDVETIRPGDLTARTAMFREAGDAARLVAAQIDTNAAAIAALAGRLRERRVRMVATCARGSSDNAATFARYLIETRIGIVTASAAPSVGSLFNAAPDMADTLYLVISQSGRSPDLLASADRAKSTGAMVVAVTNDATSPLAALADDTILLHAGHETSVAATKTFLCTLSAILQLVAAWEGGAALAAAVPMLPGQLERAWQADWSAAVPAIANGDALYVVGRGLGYAMAQEAALKLKETCGIHAEAFSAAEVQHGPMALLDRDAPVILFVQRDETADSTIALGHQLVERGCRVIVAGADIDGAMVLPVSASDAITAPVALIQSFYRLANAVSIARGLDPDQPPFLRKVTKTI